MAQTNGDTTNHIADLCSDTTLLTNTYLKDPTNKPALIAARTAARDLFFSLHDGDSALFFLLEQNVAASILRFLMSIDALRHIPTTGSISAIDLAKKLNCEVTWISRMMRMVAAAGYFSEPEQDCYAHTARSAMLLDPGYGCLLQLIMDDFTAGGCWPNLPDYYANHKNEMKSPDDPKHHPYGTAFGMDGRDWHQVIARTPELVEKVTTAFEGKWSVAPAIGIYPFEQLEEKSVAAEKEDEPFMVDVGGRNGATLIEIREAYPQLKGKMITQDQDFIINSISPSYLPDGISAMTHDFWTPQPLPTRGAKVYYLRRIMHDWPDSHASLILKHVADAMDEDSIILCAESVVPERVQREDTWVYTLDMCMFMFSGKERNAKEWKALYESAGLEVTRIWDGRKLGSTQGVVEGRKRRG